MSPRLIRQPTAGRWSAIYRSARRGSCVPISSSTFPGDGIEIFTWAASLELREVSRRYLFRRAEDDRILARAETKWVYVDLKSGRPRRVPEELLSAFEAVLEDDPELKAARESCRFRPKAC
jgi:acyl-ACP thioesterase